MIQLAPNHSSSDWTAGSHCHQCTPTDSWATPTSSHRWSMRLLQSCKSNSNKILKWWCKNRVSRFRRRLCRKWHIWTCSKTMRASKTCSCVCSKKRLTRHWKRLLKTNPTYQGSDSVMLLYTSVLVGFAKLLPLPYTNLHASEALAADDWWSAGA